MNQEIFRRRLNDILESGDGLSKEERDEIIQKSIKRAPRFVKLGIVREELSELSIAISKRGRLEYERKAGEYISDEKWDSVDLNLIEEIADVYISMRQLCEIYQIPMDILMAAIDTKLEREAERCE